MSAAEHDIVCRWIICHHLLVYYYVVSPTGTVLAISCTLAVGVISYQTTHIYMASSGLSHMLTLQ